jgi:hypothetical protein
VCNAAGDWSRLTLWPNLPEIVPPTHQIWRGYPVRYFVHAAPDAGDSTTCTTGPDYVGVDMGTDVQLRTLHNVQAKNDFVLA